MFLFSLTCSLFLLTPFGHASSTVDVDDVVRRLNPSTEEPTTSPTTYPTGDPTTEPTASPTTSPTTVPTVAPTAEQLTPGTMEPTTSPTTSPTTHPTESPTMESNTPSPTTPVLEEDGSGMSATSVLGISGGLFVVLGITIPGQTLLVLGYIYYKGTLSKKEPQAVENPDPSGEGRTGGDSPSIDVITETPEETLGTKGETLGLPTPGAPNVTSDEDFVSPRKMPTPKATSEKSKYCHRPANTLDEVIRIIGWSPARNLGWGYYAESGGSGRSASSINNRISLGLVSMMSPKKVKSWTKDDGEQPSSPLMGNSAKGNHVTSLADIEAVLTGRDPKDFK